MSVKKKEEKKNTDSISIQFRLNKKVFKFILIILVCFFMITVGYFLFKNIFKNDSIKVNWGQTYYVYLKDKKEDVDNPLLPQESENAKLNFYEVKDVEKPIMAISYQKKEELYTNVYYIQNNQVNTIIYNEPVSIDFLYNIEKNEYHYYFHTESDEEDSYTSLTEQIKDSLEQEEGENLEHKPEYIIKKDDIETITDASGKEITVSKWDSTFVKPETSEKNVVDFRLDMEEKELKDAVNSSVSQYEKVEEIVSDELKNSVEEKVEEVTRKQEEINTIKEEQERREEEKEEVFKQLQGVWISGTGGGDPCIEIGYKNKKKWATLGWFGSEASLLGEIKDIIPQGNSTYTLLIGKTEINIDITNIKKKKIKVNKETYTYVAKNMDAAYEIIFG